MKKYFALFVLLACVSSSFAQLQRRTVNLNFGLQLMQPRGEFANQYDGHPMGLAGTLSIPYRRSMIEFGGSFAWNSMGSQNENVSVLMGKDQNNRDVYARGTLRIRSNNYRYGLIARLRPFTGRVQPYADVLVGVVQFKTSTDIQVDNSGFSESSGERIDHRDFSLHAGYALGFRVRLAPLIFLDGRFESIVGGKATYVDQATIKVVQDDQIKFETRHSNTSMYTYQLGVAFQF